MRTLAHNRHEIGITYPAWDDMQVKMIMNARTRTLAQFQPILSPEP